MDPTDEKTLREKVASRRRLCRLSGELGDPVVGLGGKEVEIFGGWLGMDADGIVVGARPVWGLLFARPEDGLAFESLLGRSKDREHARPIEECLWGSVRG